MYIPLCLEILRLKQPLLFQLSKYGTITGLVKLKDDDRTYIVKKTNQKTILQLTQLLSNIISTYTP